MPSPSRGVIDLNNETIPVTLTSDLNYEPEIAEGSNNSARADSHEAHTLRVTIPENSRSYRVYRYDNFAGIVPADNIISQLPGNAVHY